MRTVQANADRFTPSLLYLGAAVVIVGAIIALIGAYWDDAWHTDLGRDTFWSPPHLALYGGVALFGFGVVMWAVLTYLQAGSLRATLRQTPLMVALLGAVVTPAAAPIDDFWHNAFGRDAVLWSPPHMMGIVGIFTLAGGALLWVSRLPGRSGRRLTTMASVGVLATLLALVFEYDSDVPQFPVLWYLPILTGLAAFGFALSHSVARDGWIATRTALIYTALMSVVILLFALFDMSRPVVPAIALSALVFDVAARRRWPRPIWAGAFAISVYAVYVPYLNEFLGGVRLGLVDVLIGLPLAFGVTWVILAATSVDQLHWPRSVAAVVTALVALGLYVSPALAHDPGQGQDVARVQLVAQVAGGAATVDAEVMGLEDCSALRPERTAARRAGKTLHGPIENAGTCRYSGKISLPERGRWFVYVELGRGGETLESWLPVMVSDRAGTFERTTTLYVPPQSPNTLPKIVTAVALYTGNIILIGLIIVLFRRQARAMAVLPMAELVS